MCGVIGIIGPTRNQAWLKETPSAALEVYRGLLTLQHRGQDAAGILSFDDYQNRFQQVKDLGLVASVFNENNLGGLKGPMAIGHTRYATVGSDGAEDLQPMVAPVPYGIGMVHNGNIVNYFDLASKLKAKNKVQLLSYNDLEVILQIWTQSLMESWIEKNTNFNFAEALKASTVLVNEIEGAYALVGMVAGVGLFGLRDPHGIRPLVLGRKQLEDKTYAYCLCSETLSLNFLGYEYVRDIEPGELIFIDREGKIHCEVIKKEDNLRAACMFEWIYFSGAESSIEKKSVYSARLRLGQVLARKVQTLMDDGNINPDFVCPVPDTSRTAAIALAESLNIPYREGLIKNRYIQRSFILNKQQAREKAVELKLSPVRSEIEGKNILLIDDSVVRGTTSKKIISLLKRYGAKRVTLGITCPPLRYGCFYGIDFPKAETLIASNKTVDQIAQYVGADEVVYLDEADVKEAIGISDLCMACVNSKYPTSTGHIEEFSTKRDALR